MRRSIPLKKIYCFVMSTIVIGGAASFVLFAAQAAVALAVVVAALLLNTAGYDDLLAWVRFGLTPSWFGSAEIFALGVAIGTGVGAAAIKGDRATP